MASIKRRPDGKWRARYRDEDGKEHAAHFDRKVDAQRWNDEATASLITGQYVDPRSGDVTLGAFYRTWADRQVWLPETRRGIDQAFADLDLDATALRNLKPSHGEKWVKAQSARGLSPVTIRNRMMHVRSVLAGAVRDKLIIRDPFATVTLPRLRKAEAAMRLPTSGEIRTMLDTAPAEFAVCIALAAFAGLRAGEIAGLQLADLEFLRRQIHIRRQNTAEGPRPPKYGSERTIYAPAMLMDLLSAQVARRGIKEPGDWVFVGRDRGPMTQNQLTMRWCHWRDMAKLKHLRLHDCRHHFASGLIASGCDPVTVQRAMGHSNAATTLAVYSHLWPTAEDRTRQAAGDIMAAALGRPADSVRTSEGG